MDKNLIFTELVKTSGRDIFFSAKVAHEEGYQFILFNDIIWFIDKEGFPYMSTMTKKDLI